MADQWQYREPVPEPAPRSLAKAGIQEVMRLLPESQPLKDLFSRRAFLETPFDPYIRDTFISSNKEEFAPAVDRIVKAIKEKTPILVWGDYDVDGMTATTALFRCLKACKADVKWSIPSRLDQGYGIDVATIVGITPPGSLIITVDNGISNVEEVAELNRKGYHVVITDHHTPDTENIPEADALIDPKLHIEESDDEYQVPGVYVGAKVGYLVVEELLHEDFYQRRFIFDKIMELIALGIISDVIDLNPTIRRYLAYGLVCLNTTSHDGLKALFRMCGAKESQKLSSVFLAYSVIPKLNAAGRMGNPSAGVELLMMETDTSPNYTVSLLAANSLKYLNADRKIIEGTIFNEAKDMADTSLIKYPNSIVLYKEGWHPGVLGIIAARIAELYNKPTIILSNEQDKIKGSGRAVENFDLFEALEKCKDHLVNFGGHRAAAGVELAREHVATFQEKFEQVVVEANISPDVVFEIDADLTIKDTYDVRLLMALDSFEPFGKCNPELIFCLKGLTVVKIDERRDALFLILKDDRDFTMIVTRYRAPDAWKKLMDKRIDILITPTFTYFTGTVSPEWKIRSIHEHETQG